MPEQRFPGQRDGVSQVYFEIVPSRIQVGVTPARPTHASYAYIWVAYKERHAPFVRRILDDMMQGNGIPTADFIEVEGGRRQLRIYLRVKRASNDLFETLLLGKFQRKSKYIPKADSIELVSVAEEMVSKEIFDPFHDETRKNGGATISFFEERSRFPFKQSFLLGTVGGVTSATLR